jgi:hypothetical protein
VNTWLPPKNLKLDFIAQVSPARTLALFCIGTRCLSDHNLAFLSNLFHDEPGFTDPVIYLAIIRRGMKSFRDNSISAGVSICVRQPLSTISSDRTRWRSRAVAP